MTEVVDGAGNPVPLATNPDGTPHNGILRYASVFGELLNTPSAPDCSDAVVSNTSWDPYHKGMDPTGFMDSFIDMLPDANNYENGDGLNTAGHRWLRSLHGADNMWGIVEDFQQKQFNIRLDHLFNSGGVGDNHHNHQLLPTDNCHASIYLPGKSLPISHH